MPDHEQFEEMCALAAGGALGHGELEKLKAHLEECYPCRNLLAELSDIHAQWLPTARKMELDCDPATEAALRMRILKRASEVGTHISRRAHRTPEKSSSTSPRKLTPILILATAAVLGLVAWGSLQVTHILAPPRHVVLAVKTSPPVDSVIVSHSTTDADGRVEQLQNSVDLLEQERADLENAVDSEKRREEAARSSDASDQQRIAELTQKLEEMRTRVAAAETQLTQVKANQATTDAVTIAQQSEIVHLNQKIAEQAATIDREQEMLASGRSIRDLIAARNLHIIDVYDTDTHGRSSPTFGRVFYTEGKSLIFYAYNLGDKQREKGEISFYVWGKQDGAPQNVRNLGTLVQDDNSQRRWVFTLTDPKVLAEIDSVFVTLEPGKRPERHPHGKHFLSAFLGSPANHP